MKPQHLFAVLILCLLPGCAAAGRAVSTVLRPVGGAVNAVTGPVRGFTN
jgi:hypothetical protein